MTVEDENNASRPISTRVASDIIVPLADNLFGWLEVIDLIETRFSQLIWRTPEIPNARQCEAHALALVAAHVFADGDIFALEHQLKDEPNISYDPDGLQLVARSLAITMRNKDFVRQAYDGDTTVIVQSAIQQAREELHL